jgi:hypothetical protein
MLESLMATAAAPMSLAALMDEIAPEIKLKSMVAFLVEESRKWFL